MASFSLEFPDAAILAVLGDDIFVYNPGGGKTLVKGEFAFRYMEDELGDTIGIHYPVVVVDDSQAKLFGKKYRVDYNNNSYSVLQQIPSDIGKTMVLMRAS